MPIAIPRPFPTASPSATWTRISPTAVRPTTGFTSNLRKRFSNHYEFLASYTWSHAIDDSTDLQSPLAPQRQLLTPTSSARILPSTSGIDLFAQWGCIKVAKLGGASFPKKFFSNWTVAPIIEFSSGRPFLIITGDDDNFQLASNSARPSVVSASAPPSACGTPTVASRYSPTGFLEEPCYVPYATPGGPTPTLLALDGNLGRNAGVSPWTVFNDLRISRRVSFGERVSMDLIAT